MVTSQTKATSEKMCPEPGLLKCVLGSIDDNRCLFHLQGRTPEFMAETAFLKSIPSPWKKGLNFALMLTFEIWLHIKQC